MAFQRIVNRKCPDGIVRTLYPFHISFKGMESFVLCRDEDDYDVLEKYFHVCSWHNNVLVISRIAMSNHGHMAVLATHYDSACRSGEAVKKNYSQYITYKYGEKKTLLRADINVQYLDSDWYVRNVLAYIPRNAMDTGARIEDYPWSSYRGAFLQKGKGLPAGRPVAFLGRRERESLFRTHVDLSHVPWTIDADGHLVPVSCCDNAYLESAFNNDQAFFLKTIGSMNPAEMDQKLLTGPRQRKTDTEFLVIASDIADRWFHRSVPSLTLEQKARLLPTLYRTHRTSINQLARCLQMERQQVEQMLKKHAASLNGSVCPPA